MPKWQQLHQSLNANRKLANILKRIIQHQCSQQGAQVVSPLLLDSTLFIYFCSPFLSSLRFVIALLPPSPCQCLGCHALLKHPSCFACSSLGCHTQLYHLLLSALGCHVLLYHPSFAFSCFAVCCLCPFTFLYSYSGIQIVVFFVFCCWIFCSLSHLPSPVALCVSLLVSVPNPTPCPVGIRLLSGILER